MIFQFINLLISAYKLGRDYVDSGKAEVGALMWNAAINAEIASELKKLNENFAQMIEVKKYQASL